MMVTLKMFNTERLSRFLGKIGLPLLWELPFFFVSFILQSPILISYVRNAPMRALYMFVNISDSATADLYFAIAVSAVFAYCVFSLTRWSRSVGNGVKMFLYVILVLTFVSRKFLLWEFGLQLTPSVFSLVGQTNSSEVNGFVNIYVLSSIGVKYALLSILMGLIICFFEFSWKKLRVRISKERTASISGTIMVVWGTLGVLSMPAYSQLLHNPGLQSTFSALHGTFCWLHESKVYSETFWRNVDKVHERDVAQCSEDSINVVFVLGESFIKSHSSVYGYYLNTMPWMKKLQRDGNLFAYNDIVSLTNGTNSSMRNMLCLNDFSSGELWHTSVYWIQLFKKAGFGTYMWDNQKEMDRLMGNVFFEMYSPSVVEKCYTKQNKNSFGYDGLLVEDFIRNVGKGQGKNFVWFHLRGQHFDFADKFPKEFAHFSLKDIRSDKPYLDAGMRQTICDYENAIYYNDMVLNKIIEHYKDGNSVLVFISDHGEEVYDYRPKALRPLLDDSTAAQCAHCQFDTPMFVWLSDKYIEKHEKLVADIRKTLNNKSMSDKIGHTMLRLGSIVSPYYDETKDVTSPIFKASKRYILINDSKSNYDELIRK